MNEEELESFITGLIDNDSAEMLELAEGGVINGRKAKSSEVVGSVAVSVGADCVSGKNILQD